MVMGISIPCQYIKPIRIHLFIPSHFILELLPSCLSGLMAVQSSFITHHRHILRKLVMLVSQLFTKLHPLLGIHQIYYFIRITGAACQFRSMIITETGTPHCSSLRRHHNHTVGSPGTVQCCCRRVLQHINALNILGIDTGNGVTDDIDVIRIIQIFVAHIHRVTQNKTVQYPQRFTISYQGRSTTDTDTWCRTDLTGIKGKLQFRNPSFQSLVNTCHTRY